MTEDPHRWDQPFAALWRAYDAQLEFWTSVYRWREQICRVHLKILMYADTVVSFAVDVAKKILSLRQKQGSKLIWIKTPKAEYDLPDYEKLMAVYEKFAEAVHTGKVLSAYVLDRHGVVPAVSKMAFGNSMGVKLSDEIPAGQLFTGIYRYRMAEVEADKIDELGFEYVEIGEVTAGRTLYMKQPCHN